MTNETHPISDLDSMLKIALDALDDCTPIDYLYDDPHSDPETYLADLPAFQTLNAFDPATDDFFARDDYLINDQIITDLILAAIADAFTSLNDALIKLQK